MAATLVADDETMKERSTLEKSGAGVDFMAYFEAKNKKMKGEPMPSHLHFHINTLLCDEGEKIDIPKGAIVVGAYWGDGKNYAHGKDITAKVIMFIREKGYSTIFGNTEWFGDPWYGSSKKLMLRIAMKKTAPEAAAVAPAAVPGIIPAVASATHPAASRAAIYPAAAYLAAAPAVVYPARPLVDLDGDGIYDNIDADGDGYIDGDYDGDGYRDSAVAAQQQQMMMAEQAAYQTAAQQTRNVAADARIEKILQDLHLDMWIPTFHQEGVDLESMKELTEDDLKELGLRLGERKRFLRWVAKATVPAAAQIGPAAPAAAAAAGKEILNAALGSTTPAIPSPAHEPVVSRYNQAYYCEVEAVTKTEAGVELCFSVHGDMSLGALQAPRDSCLRHRGSHRMFPGELMKTAHSSSTLIQGKLRFMSGDASLTDLLFRYGSAGYSSVSIAPFATRAAVGPCAAATVVEVKDGTCVQLAQLEGSAPLRFLHSHPLKYYHLRSRHKQQVTTVQPGQDVAATWWVVEGDLEKKGSVQIHLRHRSTGAYLSSQRSTRRGPCGPRSRYRQEVSAVKSRGPMTMWRVEGNLALNKSVKLVHQKTGQPLYAGYEEFEVRRGGEKQGEVTAIKRATGNRWTVVAAE